MLPSSPSLEGFIIWELRNGIQMCVCVLACMCVHACVHGCVHDRALIHPQNNKFYKL